MMVKLKELQVKEELKKTMNQEKLIIVRHGQYEIISDWVKFLEKNIYNKNSVSIIYSSAIQESIKTLASIFWEENCRVCDWLDSDEDKEVVDKIFTILEAGIKNLIIFTSLARVKSLVKIIGEDFFRENGCECPSKIGKGEGVIITNDGGKIVLFS